MQAQCLLWENTKLLCVHAKFLRRTKSCKQSFLWGNAKHYCADAVSWVNAKLSQANAVSQGCKNIFQANKHFACKCKVFWHTAKILKASTKFLVVKRKTLSVQMQCFLWVCKTFASNQSFPAERKMFDCKQIVTDGYSRGETGSICSSLYSETNKTSEQEHNNQLNTT